LEVQRYFVKAFQVKCTKNTSFIFEISSQLTEININVIFCVRGPT